MVLLQLSTVSAARAGAARRSAHLDRAVQAVGDRDYEKARVHLKLALRAGGHDRADTVLIYRLSGEVAAAFGYRAEAEDLFRHMLAVEPRADVAVNEAPLVVEPYDAARAYFAEDHASIHVDIDRESGRDGDVVSVRIASDPLRMIAAARLLYRDRGDIAQRDQPVSEGGDVSVNVPERLRATASITVVDRYGNQLIDPLPAAPPPVTVPAAAAASDADAPAAMSLTDEAVPAAEERSLLGRWYTWGALSVASGAAATYFGMRANARWAELDAVIDSSDEHAFDEARQLEEAGRRDALVSNIAIGAAVTTAVISVALIVRDARGSQPTQRLVPVATRNGAGIAYGGSF